MRKRNKYGAVKTFVDGIKFDSKLEAGRASELRLLEKSDEIAGLVMQKKFPLVVKGKKICDYIADFCYTDLGSGNYIVEDCKSPETAKDSTYRIKKKLMAVLHEIEITEIYGR